MATRTVRLDEEAEEALREVQEATGLPISEALKKGLRALQQHVRTETTRTPYDVYKKLNLGAGGWAIAPAGKTAEGVRRALRKKLGR